jgi:hypothetical protein
MFLLNVSSLILVIPWNIQKNYNPINEENKTPKTPEKPKNYIYGLHIQPKMTRIMMVMTTSFNLNQLLRQPPEDNENVKISLQKIQEENI